MSGYACGLYGVMASDGVPDQPVGGRGGGVRERPRVTRGDGHNHKQRKGNMRVKSTGHVCMLCVCAKKEAHFFDE